MSAPLKTMRPEVSGNSPQMRLTIVLLPEPLGPMRPRISPRATVRSTPSTARTPPKCLQTPCSSSTGALLFRSEEPPQGLHRARIEQTARAYVHGQHDQAAEQEVAPIAHEAQTFDQ